MLTIVVEGWRFLPHSYSLVNQSQCLELLKRPDVSLYHAAAPEYHAKWNAAGGITRPEDERAMQAIPPPPGDLVPDVHYRIAAPFRFSGLTGRRNYVFATCEASEVFPLAIEGQRSVREAVEAGGVTVITPSRWSASGFLRGGVKAARVKVVPHGVDTTVFRPLAAAEREAQRRELGWSDRFVLLNVGAMLRHKGVDLLLKSFAALCPEFPSLWLAAKGMDALYGSNTAFRREGLDTLSGAELQRVRDRTTYIGKTLTQADMARLFQCADAYVSPYRAEGFNLPVLEAAACGLPIICTAGGPTDEFTTPEFALRVAAGRVNLLGSLAYMWQFNPEPKSLAAQIRRAVTDRKFRERAAQSGPAFVQAGWTWKHAVDKLLDVIQE